MADAQTTAPAATTDGAQAGGTPTGSDAPGAKPETAQARKLRLRGLDGDGEQEYDEAHLVGLAKRGRNAAQLVSLAEKKAQEAAKKERDTEAKLARLKDPKTARAALRELGVDVRGMSEAEILEVIEEEKLSPEQKRIRELERAAKEREEADAKTKREAEEARLEEETERERDNLSNLFQDVMQSAGLPRESATAVGYRLVPLFKAAHAAGMEVDPELAAERVKAALKAEHKAMFTRRVEEPGKPPREEVDLPALATWLGPDVMLQVRKAAVQEYLKQRSNGQQTAQPAAEPQAQQRAPAAPNGPKKGSPAWWDSLRT